MLALWFALALAAGPSKPPVQQPPPIRPGAPGPASPATKTVAPVPIGPFEFDSDLGVFLVVVKADKAAGFETAMSRVKQAMQQSTNPLRKQQAVGWRVLKSTEAPTDGNILYIWLIDPATKKVNYNPLDILREGAPADVQSAYDQIKDAYVSITRVGLKEAVKMGGG